MLLAQQSTSVGATGARGRRCAGLKVGKGTTWHWLGEHSSKTHAVISDSHGVEWTFKY